MLSRMAVASLGAWLSIPVFAHIDESEVKKAIKSRAEEVQTAVFKGDAVKVVDLTHPKAVENLGGKVKMAATLTKDMKEMKEKGFEFKTMKVLDPSDPVSVGKELYVVVPYVYEVQYRGTRWKRNGSLIGVSSDKGTSWVFLDTIPGREKLKELLPDLPASLVIPKIEPPTMVKAK